MLLQCYYPYIHAELIHHTFVLENVCSKVTFFAPEGTRVTAYLDTVDLPSLNPTTTQTGLVAPPPVLLAQQHIHPALRPLCGPPAVPKEETRFRIIGLCPIHFSLTSGQPSELSLLQKAC